MFRFLSVHQRGLVLLFFLLAPLITVGCTRLGSFTMVEESEEIVIQGQPTGLLGELAALFPTTIPLQINLEQELEAQDAGPARAVYLTELEFVMTDTHDPDGANTFDFIDDVLIEIESRTSDSALPREPLAWLDDIPTGARRLTLEVDDALDLKPYIEEGLRLRSKADGSTPRKTTSFKVVATFQVHLL